MVQRCSWGSIALAILGVWSQSVLADGFRNPPDTAAALGKSGKHIVWVDEASALFYNPANLVDVPSRQVQISGLLGYSHADYDGQLGEAETEKPWSQLPAFAIAWPLKSKDLALGFGLHVPFGRQTRWDEDEALRYAAPELTKMMVMDLSSSLAWSINDSVSIGAGLDLYYGKLKFRQLLPFPDSRVSAEMDDYATGANAGLTWRVTPKQRLALTYRSPFDLRFSGDMETTGVPPPAVAESDINTTFKFPTIVAVGYGVQVTDTVRVEANVEWLQFSRFETMTIQAGENDPLVGLLGLASTPQKWNDTWTFGLGADWRFAADWTLRAGYLYLPSPIPDSTFTPSTLDVDQSVVSAGFGYQAGRHAIDFAYAIGLFDTRRVDGNQNTLYQNGVYDFQGHLAALSYAYSF